MLLKESYENDIIDSELRKVDLNIFFFILLKTKIKKKWAEVEKRGRNFGQLDF